MKVLIATGGTGGHIFPAEALANEIKRRGHSVVWGGSLSLAESTVSRRGEPVYTLDLGGLASGALSRRVKAAFKMAAAIGAAQKMVSDIRPDRMIGFGGYSSFPFVRAACRLNIPSVIHEQNVVPGWSNRWLGRYAQRIGVSFRASRSFFPSDKVVLTGCPVRGEIMHPPDRSVAAASFGLKPERLTILIFGGSQGSHNINSAVYELYKLELDAENMQLIHVTGRREYEDYKARYGHDTKVCVLPFCSTMPEAYAAADLVVGRAGAMTIWELALLHKPAVLIPYPHAQAHQSHNAAVLSRCGLAEQIADKELNYSRLRKAMDRVMQRPVTAEDINRLEAEFFTDAASRLADQVLQ